MAGDRNIPDAPTNLERCCPGALVRHSYDADFYVLNRVERSAPLNKRNHRYECAACGKQLHEQEPTDAL